MRNCLVYIAILLTLLTGSGCKKNFSSSQFVEDKMVILSEISAGDSIRIPVGKSIRVGNGNIIRFDKVNDARVQLKEGSASWLMLNVNYSPQYSGSPASMYTNRRRLRSNTTYTLEVTHPILGTVRATTHVPPVPRAFFVDSSFKILRGKRVLELDINLAGPFDENSLFVFEAVKELMDVRRYFFHAGARQNYETPQGKTLYAQLGGNLPLLRDTISQNKFLRLHLFTEDPNTENARLDNLENPFRRIFLSQLNPGAANYPVKLFVDPQFFKSNDATQKGRVRIEVKQVSRELFDYWLTYEKYKTDFGVVPSSQLVSPGGNLSNNGLGIFGGSARRERIYYFDNF